MLPPLWRFCGPPRLLIRHTPGEAERTGVEPACPGGRPVSNGMAYRSPHLSGKGRWESRTPKTAVAACPVSSGVGLPHARTFRGLHGARPAESKWLPPDSHRDGRLMKPLHCCLCEEADEERFGGHGWSRTSTSIASGSRSAVDLRAQVIGHRGLAPRGSSPPDWRDAVVPCAR